MDYTKLDFEHKTEVLSNTCALHLAIDALAQITEQPYEEWVDVVTKKAAKLTDKLSESEVEEQIQAMEEARKGSDDTQTVFLRRRQTS